MKHKTIRCAIYLLSAASFLLVSLTAPLYAAISGLSPESFNQMYNFAAQGNTDVLSSAIGRGLDIDAVNSNGDTGLCVAVKRRNAKAFNTFVAMGANENHPCTRRIPYYNQFVQSPQVRAGYLWSKEDYSAPVYHFKKEDNTWQWVGLLAAVGGGAALLLSGGGGGGSSGDGTESGGETPGLSCEYGCAEYDINGTCIRCNDAPSGECVDNPCAEGCYTDITCPQGQECVSFNSCGGCQQCGYSGECADNPCAEGCYTDITCPQGQVCTSVNSCGGCQQCGTAADNANDFVSQAEGDVNNTNDLSNLGNNKTGTWGGIFSNQGSITNSGNIVLSGGNSAVGIMSAASEESDEVLSGSITTGGKNINNQGNILITADSSYGILAQSLANVANESLTGLNTLQSSGVVYTQGADNTGILLLGNGNLNNSGQITMIGTASSGKFDTSYISSSSVYSNYIGYLLPSTQNSAISFVTNLTNAQRGYEITNSVMNKAENSGNINMNISSDAELLNSWTNGNSLSVSGFNSIINPQNEYDQFSVSNSGDIEVAFSFDDSFMEKMNSSQRQNARQNYFVAGMNVLNTSFVMSEDASPTLQVTNEGNINLSGNGYMHGMIVSGVNLDNRGDININMSTGYAGSSGTQDIGFVSMGLLAANSVVNQYADINYSTRLITGYDFYSAVLDNSILNVNQGAVLNGSILANNNSTINNSGSLLKGTSSFSANSITGLSVLNNAQSGTVNMNSADITELYNLGILELSLLKGNADNAAATKIFVNEAGGKATVETIGRYNNGTTTEGRYQSVVNNGTLRTSLIATEEFSNQGVINTDGLSYYSFNSNGNVDLQNVQFDVLPYISSDNKGTLLDLNSRYQDAFILGDISVVQQGTETGGGGTVVLYSDWSNADASADNMNSLTLGNINVDMSSVLVSSLVSTGVNVSRNYVDVTSDKQITLKAPGNIIGVQLNGTINNFTHNGLIELTSVRNPNNLYGQTSYMIGVALNGEQNSLLNNGSIIVNGSAANFSGIIVNSGIYGIGVNGGDVTLSESSIVEVSSSSGRIDTAGVFLEGEAQGVNNGKITVTTTEGGTGVYALQTSSNGFENKGSIIVNSDNGVGMYGDGYVDGTNDRYIKLINSGTIIVNGSQGIGIYASGANSEVLNTGMITVDNPDNNIVLEKGAQLINDGTMSTMSAFNIDDITANGGSFVTGKNGVLQTKSVSGTMYAASSITLGSNADNYTKEQAVISENNQADLLSQSVMFTADFQDNDKGGQDIVMNRKDFGELVSDKILAQYLENNYQSGNGVTYFDDLKTAQNGTDLNSQIAGLTGQDVIPAFAYQDMERIRNINRTMADLMTDNQNNKEERVSVVSDNYYRDIGNVGQVSGWEDSLFGISGLFDKRVNAKLRYGIGVGMYRAYTDFDNGAERTNNLFEIYNPYWFEGRKFGILVMPYVGYANGDYERYENAKKYTGDIDSWYYGINNRVYGKYQLWGIQLEPRLELNINGVYTDKIKEDKGLTIDSRDTLSSEAGIGLYAEKKFDFNSYGNLNIGGGAMYYYELNSNAYKDIDAALYGMEGNYLLYGYNNRRSRGLISVKADYNIKGWSIYGNIMRMLERDDNMIYNAGIRYSF